MENFGKKGKDKITGFEGIINSRNKDNRFKIPFGLRYRQVNHTII